jgi:hypothetical protein
MTWEYSVGKKRTFLGKKYSWGIQDKREHQTLCSAELPDIFGIEGMQHGAPVLFLHWQGNREMDQGW